MRNDDGYWQRDGWGSYHWVKYSEAAFGWILIFAMIFLDQAGTKIYNFLSYGRIAIIALVLTGIICLIFKRNKIVVHVLNFIYFVLVLFMIKFVAAEYMLYSETGIGGIFDELIGTFVIGLIIMIVFMWGGANIFFGNADGKLSDCVKGVITQAIGTGVFCCFDILGVV